MFDSHDLFWENDIEKVFCFLIRECLAAQTSLIKRTKDLFGYILAYEGKIMSIEHQIVNVKNSAMKMIGKERNYDFDSYNESGY